MLRGYDTNNVIAELPQTVDPSCITATAPEFSHFRTPEMNTVMHISVSSWLHTFTAIRSLRLQSRVSPNHTEFGRAQSAVMLRQCTATAFILAALCELKFGGPWLPRIIQSCTIVQELQWMKWRFCVVARRDHAAFRLIHDLSAANNLQDWQKIKYKI